MKATYEVVVGNVGTVYRGEERPQANKVFDTWVEQSKLNIGRAGGEPVDLICDGQPVLEYEPPLLRPPLLKLLSEARDLLIEATFTEHGSTEQALNLIDQIDEAIR